MIVCDCTVPDTAADRWTTIGFVTGVALMLNVADALPAGIVTVLGITRALLDVAIATTTGSLGAGMFNVTVPVVVCPLWRVLIPTVKLFRGIANTFTCRAIETPPKLAVIVTLW